jgi:hypothetical protein
MGFTTNPILKFGAVLPETLSTLLGWVGGFFSVQNVTAAVQLTVAQVASSSETILQTTGSSQTQNLTTPTAAQLLTFLTTLFGFVPPVGLSWQFEIQNQVTTAGTLTLVAGTGVSISGTATVLFGTNRTWMAQITNTGANPTLTLTNVASRTI